MCIQDNLNDLKAPDYKKRLEKWLSKKQSEAVREFNQYVNTQRALITAENNSITRSADGLITGIGKRHKLADPSPMNMEYPKR